MKKNWEEKWDGYITDFALERCKDFQDENLKHFLESSILLANVALVCIAELISDFTITSEPINIERFHKKLSKMKRKEIEELVKIFLFDYISIINQEKHLHDLLVVYFNSENYQSILFNYLSNNKNDKKIFNEIKEKNDTVFHSTFLLKSLHVEKESKNEALVLAIEEIKNQFYNNYDNNLLKFFQKK